MDYLLGKLLARYHDVCYCVCSVFVFGRTMPAMAVIMGFVMYVAFISVSLGAAAHIYGTLSKELDAA